MRARMCTAVVIGATLVAAGAATRPLIDPVWRELREDEPALNLRNMQGAVGQGLTLGLLGGFRGLAADFLWLEMNSAWEECDLPATQSLINLVTTVDPRPLYFWLNGARIIAYDIPAWRIIAAGGYHEVPASEQRRIAVEQAQVAFALLHRALQFHPEHPLLILDFGHIHLNRLDDVAAAAEFYRRAAELPAAPYYAARIYAELLKRLDRQREAYAWLCQLHPTLPPDDVMAMAPEVLRRIRELEEQLAVPETERYHPPEHALTVPGF